MEVEWRERCNGICGSRGGIFEEESLLILCLQT